MAIYHSKHTIQGLPQLGGGDWIVDGLTDVTVLMGKNGSGKSVLLRSWRDQNPDQVHYVVPERTGDLVFQSSYINEEFRGDNRRGSSTRNFTNDYRRRILARVHAYLMKRGNNRGEGPAPGNPDKLEELLRVLIPDFSFRFSDGDPPFLLARISDGETISLVEQLSSGEAQLLTLALDILTIAGIWEVENRRERVMLVDEPDAHIHPDLQARFADFMFRLVDQFSIQFIIATHSTSLMSASGQFGQTRTSIIYIERNRKEYKTQLFDEVTKEIASCLGGHVLMGPLFGAPLLLVEGDDDYRIWSQVSRHNVINLAVLPCNGEEIKKYQHKLERIFAALCEERDSPIGFVLLDGDKALPQPTPDRPQGFVQYIRLNCHEAENLYLTDIILKDLGHTWESATDALLKEASNFGQKKEELEKCLLWDRQLTDVKGVINEIARVLDKKNLHWTVRVGNGIGRERPSGDLADFLGPQVLSALWG